MKYLKFLVIIMLLARCNNSTPITDQQKGEVDSTFAEGLSFRLASTLAVGDNVVTFVIPMQNVSSPSKPDTTVVYIVFDATGAYDTSYSSIIKYKDPVVPPPPPPANNQKPIIKTGPDQTISVAATTLNGSGSSDPEGSVLTFKWVQETGNATTMVTVGAVCNVSNITPGDYRYRLTVTDKWGLSNTDTIHVKRTGGTPPPPPPPGNQLPVVNAGGSQSITLPLNSVTLTGSATDADGTIAAYLWSKQSGTGGTISSPSNASTTVTGLSAGTYVFNLKATDNAGGVGNKTTTVTVGSATPPPTAGYTETFRTGFDAMSDMLYGGNGQYGNGTISTTTYKTGPGSFYSRPANVSSGNRSEVQYGGSAQNNTEGAIEYDVLYEVVVSDNIHSFQWHPNTGGGSASPGLWHIGGKFAMVNWINGGNQEHPTGITIATNKWYHIRFEFKFSNNGYFRMYLDGVLVCSWTGQVGDGSGQYVKAGVNTWSSNGSTSRVYYDNLVFYRKN